MLKAKCLGSKWVYILGPLHPNPKVPATWESAQGTPPERLDARCGPQALLSSSIFAPSLAGIWA